MSVSVTSTARSDAKPQTARELLFQPVQVGRYHLRHRIVMIISEATQVSM
jgi:N-ethylmaleimide reductase